MSMIVMLINFLAMFTDRLFDEILKNYAHPVKYRDTIILRHVKTNSLLHSHSHCYTHSGTSGQQEITTWTGSDGNDYWIVKGPYGQPDLYKQGEPVKSGDIIRLEHLNTHVNLHSHQNYPSPASRQQEVTGFGHSEVGNGHDNWRVELHGKGIWYVGRKVRLIHLDTNHALHSHAGWRVREQQEVTCYQHRDDNDWWIVPF